MRVNPIKTISRYQLTKEATKDFDAVIAEYLRETELSLHIGLESIRENISEAMTKVIEHRPIGEL